MILNRLYELHGFKAEHSKSFSMLLCKKIDLNILLGIKEVAEKWNILTVDK